jgi:hypothetical protein
MQLETRDIHVLDGVRGIQCDELKTKPARMRGPYPRCAAGFTESAQAFVAYRRYHQSSIAACCVTRKNSLPFSAATCFMSWLDAACTHIALPQK